MESSSRPLRRLTHSRFLFGRSGRDGGKKRQPPSATGGGHRVGWPKDRKEFVSSLLPAQTSSRRNPRPRTEMHVNDRRLSTLVARNSSPAVKYRTDARTPGTDGGIFCSDLAASVEEAARWLSNCAWEGCKSSTYHTASLGNGSCVLCAPWWSTTTTTTGDDVDGGDWREDERYRPRWEVHWNDDRPTEIGWRGEASIGGGCGGGGEEELRFSSVAPAAGGSMPSQNSKLSSLIRWKWRKKNRQRHRRPSQTVQPCPKEVEPPRPSPFHICLRHLHQESASRALVIFAEDIALLECRRRLECLIGGAVT